MAEEQPGQITVEQRRAIFKSLVEAQDGGASPPASRTTVARQFAVTEDQVRDIEREGMANQWPPLD